MDLDLAGPITSSLVLGLNGKAVAEYTLPLPNGFGRRHQKDICIILNFAIPQGDPRGI